MSTAEFTASATRTVTGFVPNGQRFENIVTGRQLVAGTLSFDCGHSYTWFPHGLADHEPLPAAGQRLLCADCIEAWLNEVQS